jgi:hypothetical protein
MIFYSAAMMWMAPRPVGAIYPPLGFDLSLVHLSLTKAYTYNHAIMNPWWVRGAFLPQLPHALFAGGIVFLNGIGLRGDLFPAFCTAYFTLVPIIAFQYFFGRRFLWTLLVGFLALSFPVIRWHLSTAYMDPPLNAFLALAFVSSLAYQTEQKSRYLFLTFFFSAAAFSCKHFAGFMAFPFLAMAGARYFYDGYKLKSLTRHRLLKDLFVIAVAVLPILTVFFHYNWQRSGKPLFPFQFGEPNQFYWSLQDANGIRDAIVYYTKNQTWKTWLTLPWEIATNNAQHSDSGNYIVGYMWPAFLAISVFCFGALFRTGKKNWTIAILLVTVIVESALWYKASPIFRYLTAAIWMLTILTVLSFKLSSLRIRVFAGAIILILVIHSWSDFSVVNSTPPPLSRPEYLEYLKKNLVTSEALQEMYLKYGDDRNIIIYSMHDEGAWLFYPYPFLGDWFGQSSYDRIQNKDPQQLRQFYSERRITHVLSNELYPTNKEFLAGQGEYQRCYELAFQGKIFEQAKIYRLKTEDPFCFQESIPALPNIAELKTQFPIGEIVPFWPSRSM